MSSEVELHVTDMLPDFVLDALTNEETNQVVEHLAGCQVCQAELRRLQQVADDLPLALAQTAPPLKVKDQLMSAIHARKVNTVQSRPASAWQKLAAFLRQPLPALGVAMILILAVGNILLWRQLLQSGGQANTPMRVLALANTQDAPGAVGTLIMDQRGDYGTIVVDNLAELASDQQYQIWLIKDGQRTSGGIFSVNHHGYASLELIAPDALIQYDSVGITIEPFGGSPGPTGAKVLGGTITR